jgi:hypothetical protein
VVNLLVGRAPLYGLGDWAAPYAPHLLGLPGGDTAWLNDDRVGRALVALFDADRASLLTELIVGVIGEFGIDTSEMHNDSTSVSVHGRYAEADGSPRRGKPTPAVTFGHSNNMAIERTIASSFTPHLGRDRAGGGGFRQWW